MDSTLDVGTASGLYARLESLHRPVAQARPYNPVHAHNQAPPAEPIDRVKILGTEVAGDVGHDGGPGLWAALRRFMERHREWSVIDVSRESAGFVTISRIAADKPPLPSKAAQVWTYLKSRTGEFWNGRKLVSLEVLETRLSHCWVCPYRADSRCTKCGCHLDRIPDDALVEPGGPGKAARAAESCPIGLW